MQVTYHVLAPLTSCSYLPGEMARMEYVAVAELSPEEYAARMMAGWRRFGHMLFRPRCEECHECRSIRVDVSRFRPNRNQKRVRRANQDDLQLEIGTPRVSSSRLDLYRRFHEVREHTRGWGSREDDPISYHECFVLNPFPTEEWQYMLDGRLVGLGIVDALPVGLSAIYFVHSPEHHERSLGTWNVLCLIEETQRRGLPYLYLGYWVAGCVSLAYKASFRPFEVRDEDGTWKAIEPE